MDFEDGVVIDSRWLRERGISPRQIARLIRTRRLHRVEQGVYTTSPPTGDLLLRALMQRRPWLIFTGRTSLEIRQGREITLPVQAVVGPKHNAQSSRWITVLRRKTVGSEHIRGFTVTVGAVAVAHAEGLTDAQLIEFLEANYTGHAGKERLAEEVATMAWVPETFRALVSRAAVGADSEAERTVVRALVEQGLAPEQNVLIGGYYFDILLRQSKVIVEIDGYTFHSAENRETFVRDRWKANYATRHGYRVLRYSGSCVAHHLRLVVEQIVAAAAESGEELGTEESPVWRWHHILTRDAPWPEEVAQ